MRPRHVVPARQQQPSLVEPVELESIRCAARSGLHEPIVLRLLDHIAIHERVIRQVAQRAAETGSPERQAEVATAMELVDPEAPIHIRLEFYIPTDHIRVTSLPTFLAALSEWTVDEIAALVDSAQATATYRGESESWETRMP